MELGNRLECVLSFVRKGTMVYDIGSDHGYLPLELIKRGICERAVVTDLNRGPLERGKLTFLENGLTDKAEFYLTDGLSGLEFGDGKIDICICGMGGELIADIINARPDVYKKDAVFILQPMTKIPDLRIWLWDHGFKITAERAVSEGKKIYAVMVASYMGRKASYRETDVAFGKKTAVKRCREADLLNQRTLSSYKKRVNGLKKAGLKVDSFERLYDILEEEMDRRRIKK